MSALMLDAEVRLSGQRSLDDPGLATVGRVEHEQQVDLTSAKAEESRAKGGAGADADEVPRYVESS
jgi:hypothetical protein